MAHDRLRDNLLEVGRGGIIPLFYGAAECMIRNASHEQSFEHHRGLLCTLDPAVLEVNTCKMVLEKCWMEASLPQAVREGMANPIEVQLRATIASVPNELGAHEALNHMPRMA